MNPLIIFILGTSIVIFLISTIFLFVYLYQKKLLMYERKIIESQLKKQDEIFSAIRIAEENERKRIAEELHDGVGANLSGVVMSLEYLKNKSEGFDQLVYKRVINTLNDTVQEVREIARNLKPSQLSKTNLKEAIFDFVFHLNNYKKCTFEVVFEGDSTHLDIELQLTIYRISCELLNNTKKHAQASKASLQISIQPDIICLIAEDNGIGMPKMKTFSGIGLENIRSRLNLFRGRLTIDSSAKGSTFIIEIPLTENHE